MLYIIKTFLVYGTLSFVIIFTELKMAFDAFDHEKKGCIGTDMVGTILAMLGHELSEETLRQIIAEVDVDGENKNTNSV